MRRDNKRAGHMMWSKHDDDGSAVTSAWHSSRHMQRCGSLS